MTVKELIECLQTLEPTRPVFVGSYNTWPECYIDSCLLLDGREVVTITCTPQNDQHKAGHVCTQGTVDRMPEVLSCKCGATADSSGMCGVCADEWDRQIDDQDGQGIQVGPGPDEIGEGGLPR